MTPMLHAVVLWMWFGHRSSSSCGNVVSRLCRQQHCSGDIGMDFRHGPPVP